MNLEGNLRESHIQSESQQHSCAQQDPKSQQCPEETHVADGPFGHRTDSKAPSVAFSQSKVAARYMAVARTVQFRRC